MKKKLNKNESRLRSKNRKERLLNWKRKGSPMKKRNFDLNKLKLKWRRKGKSKLKKRNAFRKKTKKELNTKRKKLA